MPYIRERQKEYDKHYGPGRRKYKVDSYCRCGAPVEPFSTDLVACTVCKREYMIVRRGHSAQLWPVKHDEGDDDTWLRDVRRLLADVG